MNNPVLSIITVNFNNKEGLKHTLQSIRNQSFADYEHIIIDAGSTDGSRETIEEYAREPETHLTCWVSEPDKGIYDGMNKGIEKAKGEYLYFLNSGDLLVDDVLKDIPFDGTRYIYGNIKLIHQEYGTIYCNYPDVFDTFFLANKEGWISQQACFIHHSLFVDHKYDTDYQIISDWIHAVRCILLEQCTYRHLPLLVAIFDGNGESSDEERTWSERDRWIKENLHPAFFRAFVELEEYRRLGLADILTRLNLTRKFRKRIKNIIIFFYYINFLFSFHKKT